MGGDIGRVEVLEQIQRIVNLRVVHEFAVREITGPPTAAQGADWSKYLITTP